MNLGPTHLGQPRAIGAVHIGCVNGPRGTTLKDLSQQGSLRVLFPRVPEISDLLGVTINTAGGITGGDRFTITAHAGTNSRLTLTTQAAERIYRAKGIEVGRLSTDLTVTKGARLDWLPQETILFNRAALQRDLHIKMARDSVFLAVEPLVFGRITMGESLRQISFTDNIRLYRDDELIFADATHLIGDAGAQLASPFMANAAGASAAVLYAAQDADVFLPRIRELLPVTAGASLIRPGVLFARLLAPDSYILRQSLIPVIECLRGTTLPKTWTL